MSKSCKVFLDTFASFLTLFSYPFLFEKTFSFLSYSFFFIQFSNNIWDLWKSLVEMRRVELLTPCLQGRCSPNWATPPRLSALPYSICFANHRLGPRLFLFPKKSTTFWEPFATHLHCRQHHNLKKIVVGWSGLEPPTSRLSGVCSNLLSYQPLLLPFARLASCLAFSNITWCLKSKQCEKAFG